LQIKNKYFFLAIVLSMQRFCIMLQEHHLKNKDTVAPGSNEGNRNNASANQRNSDDIEPDISMEHLNRLVDMGFSRAMSIQALRISPTFVEATEYLLNAPVHVGLNYY
jgi:hypothetical protein